LFNSDMRVMVIYSDRRYDAGDTPFPPIGTMGTLLRGFDYEGDCDVMFDDYPCPTSLPDASWVTHRSQIVFIDEDDVVAIFARRAPSYQPC